MTASPRRAVPCPASTDSTCQATPYRTTPGLDRLDMPSHTVPRLSLTATPHLTRPCYATTAKPSLARPCHALTALPHPTLPRYATTASPCRAAPGLAPPSQTVPDHDRLAVPRLASPRLDRHDRLDQFEERRRRPPLSLTHAASCSAVSAAIRRLATNSGNRSHVSPANPQTPSYRLIHRSRSAAAWRYNSPDLLPSDQSTVT